MTSWPQVHFQPIHDLATGLMAGVEALLRPVDPKVVARLEKGLDPDLMDYIVDQCAAVRSRLDLPVSVNVGAGQLSQRLIGRLAATGLTLELTERAPLTTGVAWLLTGAVRAGVHVVLDDFGTGVRTVADLMDLPVQGIKIDRRFVAELGRTARSLPVLSSLLDLARGVGAQVTAEGIETLAQARLLTMAGCGLGQGFLWSPAIPADELRTG